MKTRTPAIVALILTDNIVAAAGLTKVWDFKAEIVSASAKTESREPIGVFALGFSPDGRRIAALVGRSPQDELLVILNAADPKVGAETIEANPAGPQHVSALELSWSPSGEDIMLGPKVTHLDGAGACILPDRFLTGPVYAKPDLIAAENSSVVLSETGAVVKTAGGPYISSNSIRIAAKLPR